MAKDKLLERLWLWLVLMATQSLIAQALGNPDRRLLRTRVPLWLSGIHRTASFSVISTSAVASVRNQKLGDSSSPKQWSLTPLGEISLVPCHLPN